MSHEKSRHPGLRFALKAASKACESSSDGPWTGGAPLFFPAEFLVIGLAVLVLYWELETKRKTGMSIVGGPNPR